MIAFFAQNKNIIKNDFLAGLLVALALVPESVAFAFVAGVEPLVALYASVIVCLVTSLVGGRPGMISAATAPLAVMMPALVKMHGMEYLFAAVIGMGLIQMLLSVAKIGKFVRIVPYSVLLGFLNGLAIIIFLAQFEQFQTTNAAGITTWLSDAELWTMLGLVALTMFIMEFLPRLTKAIPSALVALAVVTLLAQGLGLNTKTVGDIATVAGGFPAFSIPQIPFTFESLAIVLPYSITFALIGFVHSLMTMSVVDELTESRGNDNKVVLGQGLANFITGFFGGMGGTSMIGQTIINVKSGGKTNFSGLVAGGFLLAFIVALGSYIELIPLAALVGIMFMVVIGTFSWSSIQVLRKVPKMDAIVMIVTALMIIFTNVALAVFTGVILAALEFAWEKSKRIRIVRTEGPEKNMVHYKVDGPLFFASATNFLRSFDPKNDPKIVDIDFADSRVYDQSGIESLNKLIDRYKKYNKQLRIQHLSPESRALLQKAGDVFVVNLNEDPEYHVAINEA